MFGKDGPTFFELIHQALVSTRQGYDLLAPKFDATPFRTPDDVLEPAIAALGPIDSALDVCCGTGAAMRFLKPLCRQRLDGIDFSPGMLRQAQEKMSAAEGPAEVGFITGDVLTMAFQNEYDAAVCFGALGHILPKDEREFVRRIHRALKPGGRFVFVTGFPPSFFSLSSVISRTFNLVMMIRNTLIKPPFIMYYLTFLLPQIETLLKEEGFAVEVRRDVFAAPFQRLCLVIATVIKS